MAHPRLHLHEGNINIYLVKPLLLWSFCLLQLNLIDTVVVSVIDFITY